MKKYLIFFILTILLVCGYLLTVSMIPRGTAGPVSAGSTITMEAKDKRPVGIKKTNAKKAATKKALIHQKKVLNKITKKDTIIKNSKNGPEPSPRDVRPSGQL
jgi:hypothetical protein